LTTDEPCRTAASNRDLWRRRERRQRSDPERISGSNPARSPPQAPPSNARAGREPQNPRTPEPQNPRTREHARPPGFHARASTNTGLDPRVATRLRRVVGCPRKRGDLG
jgi:hypothetical protein